MDQQEIIADLEARAKAIGMTIGDACRNAAIHPTTFSRWKRTRRNPNPVGATLDSLRRLSNAIEQAEAGKVAA